MPAMKGLKGWYLGLVHKQVHRITPDALSRTISLARIALIVGIVFLHYGMYPNIRVSPFGGASVDEYAVATFVNSFLLFFFFSVVPLLSMISGWLYFSFLNDPQSDAATSLSQRVRRRVFSLYVPLVIWNLLYLLLLWLVYRTSSESPVLAALNIDFRTAELRQYANAIFAVEHHPLAFQFWFVRDLFLTILLSPILWLCLKRVPYAAAGVLLVAWLANYDFEIFFRPDVLLFFYLGGLIRQARVPLGISSRATLALLALYLTLVVARALAPNVFDESTPALSVATRAMRLVGVLACWGFFLHLSKTRFGRWLSTFGGLAFFLYAAHFPLMAQIKLWLWQLIPQVNDAWMVAHYLVSVVATIAICLATGVFLAHWAPGIFAALNGGRELAVDRLVAPPAPDPNMSAGTGAPGRS